MKVLIVVDMQNDFIDGALGTKEAVAIVPNVIETIKGFEGTILYTKDTHLMITWIRRKEKICRCHIASKEPTVGIWQRISRR